MLEDALLEVAQEDKYGKAEIANAGEILRVLRREIGTENFEEWVGRAAIFLQSKKVLLSWLHGEDEDGELQTEERESGEGASEENHAVIALRGMWEEWQNASTPHRRKPSEQLAGELDKTLLELSRETASVEKFMRCVREATKGEGFMPEALPADAKETKAVCFQQNQREEVRLLGEKTGAIAANGGAHQTNYIMFKERAGKPGGGKGILCSDRPFTLSTLTDQSVCYAAGFKAGQSKDASIGWQEECAATLSAHASGTEPTVCYQNKVGALCMDDYKGINQQYVSQDKVVCYALQGNGIDRADTAGCNGAGWRENECYTLNTIDRPAVCYPIDLIRESRGAFEAYDEGAKIGGSLKQSDNKGSQVVCYPSAIGFDHNTSMRNGACAFENMANTMRVGGAGGGVCYPIDSHQQDSRFKICEDGVCPTVPGQMGTGGNNGPMVLEAYSAGNGQLHQALEYEKARPLDCMHDQQIVLHPSKPPRRYIIRRLTPLECARLQGFPDWWEDGVQGSDSARYKMWGNGIALPNAAYVIGCAKKLIQGEHHRQGHDGLKERV